MFDLKLFSFALAITVARIECQGLFGNGQSPLDKLPGVGACDRIATRGVRNCMQNFLPGSVLSSFTGGQRGGNGGDICCSYSKYRACISGLNAGLKFAMEREKCPKSYSTRIIKSLGDSFAGASLKSTCGIGKGSKCPKSGTKPKKNQKPNRRTQTRGEDDVLGSDRGLGGLGGLGGGLGGLGGGLGGSDRGLGGLGGGLGGPLGGGLGGPLGGGLGGGPLSGLGSIFQNGRDRGTSRGSNKDRGDDRDPLGPVRDVFSRGRETFEQGASSVIGGLQNVFGGLGGGLGGGGRRNN